MTKHFNRSSEKEKRQQLRNAMPRAEVFLWSKIRNRQIHDCKFRRQYGVGEFVLDFYAPELKLGIELDGESHFAQGADVYDHQRQEFIESFGIQVLRFLNTDVYDNMDGVLEVIAGEISKRRNNPPRPPLAKGGRE